MAQLHYYPEMNEAKPQGQGTARLSHYGQHYFIDTDLELKGRGIVFNGEYTSEELTQYAQHKVGMKKYKVTVNAFDKLCETHDFVSELLL